MWTGRKLSVGAAAILIGCAAATVCPAVQNLDPAPATQAAPLTARNSVEQRVDKLSKALGLSAEQRARLTLILQAQRAAVAKIWSDATLLPAERAPATRAIEQHTADQIRQMLSKEQRDRYNPPKPINAQTEPVDVSKWLDMARASDSKQGISP